MCLNKKMEVDFIMLEKIKFNDGIPDGFSWYNEPDRYNFSNDGLEIYSEPETDFWQKTYYGFSNDNGHCLLTKKKIDFTFMAHFEFTMVSKYDQCGLFLRIDENNWIKMSIESENDDFRLLGAVVTNYGYSDWSTTDISPEINSIWYRISRRGKDFLLENSIDGQKWKQMRITHLHTAEDEVQVGIYSCSPLDSSFRCLIDQMFCGPNQWELEN